MLVIVTAQSEAIAEPIQPTPGDFWLHHYGIEPWEWDIDHDGDGIMTRSEFHFGTDPTDVTSAFKMWLEARDGEFRMIWDGMPGAHYRMERSDDLELWAQTGSRWVGDGRTFEVVAPFDRGQAFYRIVGLQGEDDDADGLGPIEESILGTHSEIADTDGDGLNDGDEVTLYFTDPLVPDPRGGTISGAVYSDNTGSREPVANALVYLDINYDNRYTDEEPAQFTGADGSYSFQRLRPGLYHVRQLLVPGVVQTHPAVAGIKDYNGAPDEIVNYTHAAQGVGTLDEPYGVKADSFAGANLIRYPTPIEAIDPSAILAPVGVRGEVPARGVFSRTEWMALPENAEVTVRFDEAIVDGEGADFAIRSVGEFAGETIALWVGATEDELVNLGTFAEDDVSIGVDLAGRMTTPVHYVRIVSLTNLGDVPGFDLVGLEAINYAGPASDAHAVVIEGMESVTGRDFGRQFQDLPPAVFITASGEREIGRAFEVTVTAIDDLAVATKKLSVNGTTVDLDSEGKAMVPSLVPGTLHFIASASDSAGQTTLRELTLHLRAGENTGVIGQDDGFEDAPAIEIFSPAAGEAIPTGTTDILATISWPSDVDWKVDYAAVDDIDPYDLQAEDSDYTTAASGAGLPANESLGQLADLAEGVYFLRIRARVPGGSAAWAGHAFAVGIDDASLRPQIEVTSPSPGTQTSMIQEISGSIRSDRNLKEWHAEYAPLAEVDVNDIGSDDPNWTRFAEGTSPLEDEIIGTLDATTLRNDSYIVRIVAWNDIGLGWAEPLILEVTGRAKFGRHRREFIDANIHLANLPLQVRRVYDSFNSDRVGDFGNGWTLALGNADIRETVPDLTSGTFGAVPYRDGTRVYITAPGGDRIGFTFHPEPAAKSLFGPVYRATFEPDPSVGFALEVPEGDKGFLQVADSGEVTTFLFGYAWNPDTFILIDEDGMRHTYHQDDGFISMVDAHENSITLTDRGYHHSNGLELTFERDEIGRITRITGPEDETWKYAYNDQGDLESSTDPDGVTVSYAYHDEPAHFLKSFHDPKNRGTVHYEYDESGRLEAIVDENGNRNEQSWDPASFTGTITDRRGNATELGYDARGNIIRLTDALGGQTITTYGDPRHPDLATSVTDANGHVTSVLYDARGNATEVRGNAGVFRAAYDDRGRLLSQQKPGGKPREFTWNDDGTMRTAKLPDAPKQTYSYTDEGFLSELRIEGQDYVKRFASDASGFLDKVTDDSGYSHDLNFNRAGTPLAATDGAGNRSEFKVNGSLVVGMETDAVGHVRIVEREEDGTLTVTNPDGETASYDLRSDGKPNSVTLPDGSQLTFTYDAEGNPKSVTDPAGNRTTYEFDELNRFKAFTDASGMRASLEYDAVGNIVATTDRSGRRRSFGYNEANLRTFERWHDDTGAVVREFTYRWTGERLEEVTDGEASWKLQGGAARPSRKTVTYPGQEPLVIRYDFTQSGQPYPSPTAISYNREKGQAIGKVETRYFGEKPHRFDFKAPDGTGAHVRLIFGKDGLLDSLQRFDTGLVTAADSPVSVTHMEFDERGFLARLSHEAPNGQPVHAKARFDFVRDAVGRIETLRQESDTTSFSYDPNGQLTGASKTSSYGNESYDYQHGVRIGSHYQISNAVIDTGHRLRRLGSFTYEYDPEGNLTRRVSIDSGEVTEFTYDFRNRLVSGIVRPSENAVPTTVVELAYDPFDRLIQETLNGATTWIYYNRYMPLVEFSDSGTIPSRAFFYSPVEYDAYFAVWTPEDGMRWTLQDQTGSIRGLLARDGSSIDWVDYDAFGNTLSDVPSNFGNLRSGGRFYLEPLNIYHNRARAYDPRTGRFLQEDPFQFQGGDYNLYRSAGNDLINRGDPSGLSGGCRIRQPGRRAGQTRRILQVRRLRLPTARRRSSSRRGQKTKKSRRHVHAGSRPVATWLHGSKPHRTKCMRGDRRRHRISPQYPDTTRCKQRARIARVRGRIEARRR